MLSSQVLRLTYSISREAGCVGGATTFGTSSCGKRGLRSARGHRMELDRVPCPSELDLANWTFGDFNGSQLTVNGNVWGLGNFTLPCWDDSPDRLSIVVHELLKYLTPIIIVVGATGNVLAFLVFTITHLRRQPSSIFLASLALADLGYLLSLSIVWLGWMHIPLLFRHGWCEGVFYIQGVCSFLSVWYVVAFTVERCIIVLYPLRKDRLVTRPRARLVSLLLALGALGFYSFIPWTTGTRYILASMRVCTPLMEYYELHTVMRAVDFATVFTIPSIVVIILNIRIIIKILRLQKTQKPLVRQLSFAPRRSGAEESAVDPRRSCYDEPPRESNHGLHVKFSNQFFSVNCKRSNTPPEKHSEVSDAPSKRHREWLCLNDGLPTGSVSSVGGDKLEYTKSRSSKVERTCTQTPGPHRKHARLLMRHHQKYRTARMLIFVSTLFVILKLPKHVFWMYTFIEYSIKYNRPPPHQKNLHKLAELVYYMNFTFNFFIYSACGGQFRTGLRILYCRITHKISKLRQFIRWRQEAAQKNEDDVW